MSTRLSLAEARRLALAGQGLLGPPVRTGPPAERVAAVVRRLGAVQLDTISVIARSHELVPFARLGAVGREAVEAAYWGAPHRCVEYWAHAACVIPVEDWPWYAWRRRRSAARQPAGDNGGQAEVRARLRDLGPITTEGLGGARMGGPWWDWSPLKVAAEQLLATGEVVCVERRGWRRVYDLAERAIPAGLLAQDPDDETCHLRLVREAAARLGVATVADLADYPRLPLRAARTAVEAAGLVPVAVEGWPQAAHADPALLEALGAGRLVGRSRTVLLSPFDSLVWDRRRTERLFGVAHRLEAYTPAALRQHGYFAMLLLAGGRIAGRADPRRRGTTLHVSRVSVERGAEPAMVRALVEAAGWVGCSAVAVDAVVPPGRESALRAELAHHG